MKHPDSSITLLLLLAPLAAPHAADIAPPIVGVTLPAALKGLHFSTNILPPGTLGVANLELPQ